MQRILLLSLLLSGCASTVLVPQTPIKRCGPVFVVYERDRKPEIQQAIKAGFSYWNQFLSEPIYWIGGAVAEDVEPSEAIIYVTVEDALATPETCGTTYYNWKLNGCIGVTKVQLSYACIERYGLAHFETTVRHEAGHALGLEHVSDPVALMHRCVYRSDKHPKRLTSAEIEVLRGIYD